MYLAYWGLNQAPFRGQHHPKLFHQGPMQDEALARLQFLVDERRALGLLVGPPGSGKSFLLETFARELGGIQRQTALANLVGCTLLELLWELIGQLGVYVGPAASEFRLLRALGDHIIANRYQQVSTILLFDDADEAQPAITAELLRLLQSDPTPEARLTIVITAQPTQLGRLNTRLLELAELRIDLEGWEEDDTRQFIKGALAACGRSTPIFTEEATARIHILAGGIPRRVIQLSDLALLAGAGQNLAHVDRETVETVYRELGVIAPVSPLPVLGW